jgi:adenosylhomocysteine nucleosidase
VSRTGIIVAMRAEAKCITSQHLLFDLATPVREGLMVRVCGMGNMAAYGAAVDLRDRHKVSALISFGVAGALQDQLRPGDLVLPESIVADQLYQTNLAWRRKIERCLPRGIRVTQTALAISEQILTTEAEKHALAAKTNACAVDMESGAIAFAAAEAGIPFIAIRAITDPIQFSPPAALMTALHPDGRIRLVRLLALLLKRSVSLRELLRLAPGMRAACATLKLVIQHAEAELSDPPKKRYYEQRSNAAISSSQ